MGKEQKIGEGEKEKVYDVVSMEGEATIAQLMSELGFGDLKVQRCLEALYDDGLIDWVGRDRRKVKVVGERKVKEAHPKRNVDLAYLKRAVMKGLVDPVLGKEPDSSPQLAERAEGAPPAPTPIKVSGPTATPEKHPATPPKEQATAAGESEFSPLTEAAIGRIRELRGRGEGGLAGLQKSLADLDTLHKTLLEVLELRAEYERLLATKLEKAGLKR